MIGIQEVNIQNGRLKYALTLRRNITIVKGNSGSGKTTLFDMVAEYTRLKEQSGVRIRSQKECAALVDLDWRNQLNNTKDSIVFIDEGAAYLNTIEFAHAVQESDNYYVIFCRENLHYLPYSVNEIYELKTSGKYHSLKPIFKL